MLLAVEMRGLDAVVDNAPDLRIEFRLHVGGIDGVLYESPPQLRGVSEEAVILGEQRRDLGGIAHRRSAQQVEVYAHAELRIGERTARRLEKAGHVCHERCRRQDAALGGRQHGLVDRGVQPEVVSIDDDLRVRRHGVMRR